MIRNSYVKLVPRRYIPNSEIVSIGGNQYTTTFVDIEPEGVVQNTGAVNPSNLVFSWDEATKTTTFTTGSAPNQNIFIDYPLRFTTEVVRYTQDDPVTPDGSVVKWLPRLEKHPAIPEAVTDQLNGVLSTSSTSVQINNTDYALNKYLTKYDNYKNKPAFIYGQLGENYYNLAYGFITKATSGTRITVSIKSSTKLLELDASLGNRDRYFLYNTTDYPDLTPSASGRGIPVTYGPQQYLREVSNFESIDTGLSKARVTTPDDLQELVYIGSRKFAAGISHNPYNRNWNQVNWPSGATYEFFNATSLGRDDYTPTTNPTDNVDLTRYQINGSGIEYLVVGDFIQIESSSGGPYTELVFDIDYVNNQFRCTEAGIASSTAQIFINPVSYFQQDSLFEPLIEYVSPISLAVLNTNPFNTDQYSAFYELTDSGQYLVGLEVNSWFWSTFLSRKIKLYGLVHSKPINQADYLRSYLESSGLVVDVPSFNQAQIDAPATMFSTVNDNGEIDTIQGLAQDVATSCNGIVYLNTETNEYRYRIISSSLSGVDYVLDERHILEPDIRPTVRYEDTASVVRFINRLTDGKAFISGTNTFRDSSFARVFNSEQRSKTVNHSLLDSSGVVDLKAENLNTPQVTYSFTVMSDDFFNIDIGDIVQVTNVSGRLLSIGESVNLIITARTRSVETIKLVGYEFSKIP